MFSSALVSSADVESVMNSIVSLLLILETEKQEALIESLCEKLVKFREGAALAPDAAVSTAFTLVLKSSLFVCFN